MKKILCLLMAVTMLAMGFAGCTPGTKPTEPSGTNPTEGPGEKVLHKSANGIDTYDNGYMRTELTALELTRLMGNGTNLGNTLEACNNDGSISDDATYYEMLWGSPVTTQEMISGMKAAGFDTLRIPVAWMTNGTNLADGDYTIKDYYFDRVEEVINYALNAGMYVIINDHWDGGWLGMFGSATPETREFAMEAYKAMWKQIAERYQEYSDYLIFEGANEELGSRLNENSALYCSDSNKVYLTEDEQYEMVNKINQAFVDTVRSTGGNNATRFLLIPGINTNIDKTLDDRYVMPADTAKNKLMVSVHYYDPWSYCGDGQSTVKWGTVSDFQYMIDTLGRMSKFTDAGYGVVLGEYGVLYATELQENTVKYHQAFLDVCDLNGFTSCLWDCSAFFKRNELAMVDESLGKLYAKRNVESQSSMTEEEVAIMAQRRLDTLLKEAPESFRKPDVEGGADKAVAWIMWNSSDYQVTYSVGDTRQPDSITAGLKETDVEITGEGTYTVALDFTGVPGGCSNGLAFAALGIENAEHLFPGYIIDIQEILINGQPHTLAAKPYTTSDDQNTTRVNLFNEWVTKLPDGARTMDGSLEGCSPCIIDRGAEGITEMTSIVITFYFGPPQG